MKRALTIVLAILLVFSLAACGGDTKPAGNEPPGSGKAEPEQAGQDEQQEQTGAPVKAGDQNGIISVNYNAYNDAKYEFDDYVLEQSYEHEIVSASLTMATVTELKILEYLLPLEFMGESVKSLGKYDADFELVMFQTAFGDDTEVTHNEDTGYVVKFSDAKGSTIEVKAVYHTDADSLRLEGYKDGDLALVFEYIEIAGGYAAQYHYQTVTGYDKATPIEGLCTYRIIFEGSDGSCARFDNVASQPESILGSVPDAGSFIEGATHWFTITDGSFTGNLGGKAF